MLMLPTMGRPDEVAELIDAYRTCGETAPVHVLIDDAFNPKNKHYYQVDWPTHWKREPFEDWRELSNLINSGFRARPDEKTYAFFGDHFRPLTPFAKDLADAAGDWFIAWPCDDESSHLQPAGCPTFGGELIRTMQWIMLPTAIHCCTDRVWHHIWYRLGICKHVQHVKFTRTWPVGKGSAVRPLFHGFEINNHDLEAWQNWEANQAPQMIARIRNAMKGAGFEFGSDGRIDPKHGCTPFQPGW